MKGKEYYICCICGKMCEGWGNNPDGAMWRTPEGKIVEPTFKEDDVCCNECDNSYVLPGRMYQYYRNKNKEAK